MNEVPIEYFDGPDDIKEVVSGAVRQVVGLAEDAHFDLTRLEKIILAVDYPTALASVRRGFGSTEDVTPTHRDEAVGYGMALPVLRKDEPWSVLIVQLDMVCGLLSEDEDKVRFSLGFLMHELAHVHDQRIKTLQLPGVFLKMKLSPFEAILHSAADATWSEYYACRIATRFDPKSVVTYAEIFRSSITSVWNTLARETLDYRISADLTKVWRAAVDQSSWIMRSAAYLMGSLDSLDMRKEEIDEELEDFIRNSFLSEIWDDLHLCLQDMSNNYARWHESGFEIYKPLMDIAERTLNSLGFFPENTDNNGVYVHIPFLPHNTPSSD